MHCCIFRVEMCACSWFWTSGGPFSAETWLPEAALRDGGPKSCNKCRKVWKYDGPGLHFGALWDSVGAAWEDLDDLGDGFGFNLGSAGSVFHNFVGKVRFVYFDSTLERNRYYCRSRHPSWSHLGRKVEPDRSKMASGWQVRGVRTINSAGQFVLAVKVMEPAGNQPRTESSRR